MMMYLGLVSFFFFQAEDGIRDRNVTGIQTCALPILGPLEVGSRRCRFGRGSWQWPLGGGNASAGGTGCRLPRPRVFPVGPAVLRSEERRVGRECSSGCAPYD